MEDFLKTQAKYYGDKATKAKKEANMWLIITVGLFVIFVGCAILSF